MTRWSYSVQRCVRKTLTRPARHMPRLSHKGFSLTGGAQRSKCRCRCLEKEARVSTVSEPARDRCIQRVPFHYGWLILASGALGAFMTTPGQTIGVSSFFDPVARDLALSRAEVPLYYTIGTLAGILPAPLVGHWIDRRGPRQTAGVIALAVTLA